MTLIELAHAIVTEEERLVIVAAAVFAVVATVSHAITKAGVGVSRERTRREVAAYIAEGSMSPEQGERLMRAAGKSQGCG